MIIHIIAVLLAAQAQPVDAIERHILRRIAVTRWGAGARGREYASTLAGRIRVEAARRSLDATALAAVADVESGYQPWAVGRGVGGRHQERGAWQLIPGDGAVIAARLRLAGCDPPRGMSRHLRPWWLRRMSEPGAMCEDQAVADRRRWHAHWTPTELADPWIGTYIAAWEISGHLARHRALQWPVPRECVGLPAIAPRMAVYNSPASPRAWYARRVCLRYREIR